MHIAKTIKEIKDLRKDMSGTVGFIPTMGYLHEGHFSLVRRAKKENDFVIVSIFVNPKQFGPGDDLAKYPRDTDHDLSMLTDSGADAVFLPNASGIYPPGFETYVITTGLSKILEGERRPGHFDGVCTIVSKLFNIIAPTRSYFGQKDAQQVAVMKKMVYDLEIPVEVIACETVREKNGLAMSSRNIFLSKSERSEAVCLYQALQIAETMIKEGQRNADSVKQAMTKHIAWANGKIDYISIAEPVTLEELQFITKNALVSMAVYFGKTRLIDNCVVKL
jgi:pantoate--beta-alanine ligase